jgi:dihydroxyacetone kinase-like protein
MNEVNGMQRFLNDPDNMVDDTIKGYLYENNQIEKLPQNERVIKLKNVKKKVSLVSGGGSGHEPSFIGYVKDGMLDAAAIGEIFSSPTAKSFIDAFKAVDTGQGVACIFGNYSGDNMNVKSAMMDAEDEGIKVRCVVSRDDIASAPKNQRDRRHGIAGLYYMWLIAGLVAKQGGTLDEVCGAAQKVSDNTGSICVGLHELTLPGVGHPNFHINDGEYEIGIGHHGEPGLTTYKMESSDKIACRMVEALIDDLEIQCGDEVAVMTSGLGSTPINEQYILYKGVEDFLKTKGVQTVSSKVGNLVTSLNMNGAAVTLMKLDPELKKLLTIAEKQ